MPGTHLTNLPLQLTSFIGREREIAEVKRLLDTTRLLMLTGSGGCGKTRLALQIADGLREEFPDGVWLIDLAPLADPSLVPQTVASIFDLHESDETPLTQILQNYFRAKNLVWVLDNCEHLIQACAELCEALLQACPDLKILATSREALNIAGETAFRVPSLALPDLEQLPPLDLLSQCESVRLFAARASAARSDFQTTASNAHLIAQICQRLDGMPLAIELAAARVNAFSIEEIAGQLDDGFRLLNSGSRTALPRYQTLRASIDWSYGLLSEDERVLLQHLAVFAGGFTLDAVEGICVGKGKGEIFEMLSRLVQKSLVVVKLDDKPRYRLLETIRQYAREKLTASGDEEVIRDCHLEYFIKFAQATAPKLHGPEQMQALDHLDSELDNLRAALEWSLTEGRVEKGLRLFAALAWFWERRGYWSEGRMRVESLLRHPEAAPRTMSRADGLVAAGLLASSQAAAWVGGSKASRPYLEEAIGIAREHGQAGKRSCALALTFLSNSVYAENPGLAQSQYDEAWAIVQELKEPWISALLLHQRGHWYQRGYDYGASRNAFNDSMMLFRAVGDKRWEAILFCDIAQISFLQGDNEDARRRLEMTLPYFRQTKDRQHICFAVMRLGEIASAEGDDALAKEYALEGLGIARELGSKLQLEFLTGDLGFVAVHSRELDSARTYFVESLAIARELRAKFRVATAISGFASIAATEKQARRAIRLFAFVDTLVEGRIKGNLFPGDEADYWRYLAIAREQMSDAEFRTAWDEGCAMTADQAVEYAVAEPHREPTAKASAQIIKEKVGGLTPREREVAVLIAQGKSNLEIAKALVVTERTVTTHVSNILSKLGFTSRTQIASWATAKRLT